MSWNEMNVRPLREDCAQVSGDADDWRGVVWILVGDEVCQGLVYVSPDEVIIVPARPNGVALRDKVLRWHKMIQPAAPLMVDRSCFSDLTAEQQAFLAGVSPFACQREIADYMRAAELVCIVKQNELPEAPPYAAEVVSNPGYWVGCWHSEQEAIDRVKVLGFSLKKA